jgi:site-specific DNA-methyltransferase (adenine-specific)
MIVTNGFFSALGICDDESGLRSISRQSGIPVERLRFYNDTNTVPSGYDLERVCIAANITSSEVLLHMGVLDHRILNALQRHARNIVDILDEELLDPPLDESIPALVFNTELGRLYQGDCLQLMRNMESDSLDLIYAEPPSDLKKLYPGLSETERYARYIPWCEIWLNECIRLLKHGGSLFIWNIPRLNIILSQYLNNRLSLRHWIAVEINHSLPRPGYLRGTHFSLLYYCKGNRLRTFDPEYKIERRKAWSSRKHEAFRTTMITDLWTDISPSDTLKLKKMALLDLESLKILDRVVELASRQGDTIFAPFGGRGTPYIVAEVKKRRWVGIDPGSADPIKKRFAGIASEAALLERFHKE